MSKKSILIISIIVGLLVFLGIVFLPNLLSDEDKIVDKVQRVLSKKYEIKAEYYSPLNNNGEKEVLKTNGSVVQYKISNVMDNGAGKMCINIKGELICEDTTEYEYSDIIFKRSPSEKNVVYALIPYYDMFYSLNVPDPIYFAYEYNKKYYKSNIVGNDLKFTSLASIEFKDNKDSFKEEIGSDVVGVKILPKEVNSKSYIISDNFTKELGFLEESTEGYTPMLKSAVLVGTNAGEFFVIEKNNGEYTDSVGESPLPVEFNIKRIGQESRGSSKLDIELDNFDIIKYEIKNKLSNLVEIKNVEGHVSYYSPYIVKKIEGNVPDNYFISCVNSMFDINVDKTCDDVIIDKPKDGSRLVGVPNDKTGGYYIGIVNDPYIVEKHDVLLLKNKLSYKTMMIYDYRSKPIKNNTINLKLSDGPRLFKVSRESSEDFLITYELDDNGNFTQGDKIENKIYQIISKENDVFKIENNSCVLNGKYNECVFTINPLIEGAELFKITGASDNQEIIRVVVRK